MGKRVHAVVMLRFHASVHKFYRLMATDDNWSIGPVKAGVYRSRPPGTQAKYSSWDMLLSSEYYLVAYRMAIKNNMNIIWK